MAASTDSGAIDAFHSKKPLLLSSPISACPVFPQTVSSTEQEVRFRFFLLYSIVNLLTLNLEKVFMAVITELVF